MQAAGEVREEVPYPNPLVESLGLSLVSVLAMGKAFVGD